VLLITTGNRCKRGPFIRIEGATGVVSYPGGGQPQWVALRLGVFVEAQSVRSRQNCPHGTGDVRVRGPGDLNDEASKRLENLHDGLHTAECPNGVGPHRKAENLRASPAFQLHGSGLGAFRAGRPCPSRHPLPTPKRGRIGALIANTAPVTFRQRSGALTSYA